MAGNSQGIIVLDAAAPTPDPLRRSYALNREFLLLLLLLLLLFVSGLERSWSIWVLETCVHLDA